MSFLRKNFAYGTLASGINDVVTELTMTAGHTLPTAAGSMRLTIWDNSTYPDPADALAASDLEIVTAEYSGTPNVYDIIRARETTSGVSHSAGHRVAMHYTAGMSEDDLTDAVITHESTFIHSDIALNTTHRGYTSGNPHSVTVGDIGASPTSHRHDAETLQLDGVNSDGGAFAFNTSDVVTFSQNIITTGLNITNCTVLGSNSAVFQSNADAVDFFQIKDALGGKIFTVDTVDKAVTIDTDLGTDLVDEGGFDATGTWNLGGGWTIGGGVASSTAGNELSQPIATLTEGTLYRVSFEITAWTSGSIGVKLRGEGTFGTAQTGIGTYSEDLIAGGGATSLYFDARPGGFSFVGSIDNVSVKEIPTSLTVDGTAIINGSGQYTGRMTLGSLPGINERLAVQGSMYLLDGEDHSLTAAGSTMVFSHYYTMTALGTYLELRSLSQDICLRANQNIKFTNYDGSVVGGNFSAATGFFGLGGETAAETVLELTHATPYITTQCSTHINNLGRISKWIAKGNKLDETEHTLGIAEWGHDGTGDDTKGYFRVGTNANGGVDTIVYPFKIDGSQITHIGDGTNEVQIDATGVLSLNGLAGLQLPHMMQSDSTTQTVGTANEAQVITFNTDGHHFGITRTSSSRFTILKEASYLIAISVVCDTDPGQSKDIEIWLRINGSDVANSNTILHLTADNEDILAVTYIKHFDVNDFFEFWMTGEGTDVRILATPAVTTEGFERPACPSIIMTCNYAGVD